MITGVHTMFYSSKPDELRAFIRDKLGFAATDVGGGWLIFNLPEADLGCHPTEGCDPTGAEGPKMPALIRELLCFPADLPDLSSLRPPGGNSRPEGIALSYRERRLRGELPETNQ